MNEEAVRFRIERRARPVGAAGIGRHLNRGERAVDIAERWRRVQRPNLVPLDHFQRLGTERGREVDQIVNRHALPIERRGLVGNGCVGLVRSFGTVDCGTARSSIGQIGSPVSRLSTKRNACLVGCARALTRRPLTHDVVEHGGAGRVVVPEAVMRHLVVPLALAGFDVERDQALTEQRIAGPVAAVVIAGRHLDADVDEAELEIGTELRPRAGVAVSLRAARRATCRSRTRQASAPCGRSTGACRCWTSNPRTYPRALFIDSAASRWSGARRRRRRHRRRRAAWRSGRCRP